MKSRGPAAAPGAPPQRLRIVAGTRRGRYIKVPRGAVRPTSEMVREAVFDTLGPIVGLAALDLFAGSGALGLESLSRGAAGCVFAEDEAALLLAAPTWQLGIAGVLMATGVWPQCWRRTYGHWVMRLKAG